MDLQNVYMMLAIIGTFGIGQNEQENHERRRGGTDKSTKRQVPNWTNGSASTDDLDELWRRYVVHERKSDFFDPMGRIVRRGGTILLKDGSRRTVVHFGLRSGVLSYRIEGQRTETNLSQVRAIWFLKEPRGSVPARVVFLSGAEIESEVHLHYAGVFPIERITYYFLNPATGLIGESSVELVPLSRNYVKALVFDNEDASIGTSIGTYRRCAKDNDLFPADYLFCPYHGTELALVRDQKGHWMCPDCKLYSSIHRIHCHRCGHKLIKQSDSKK